MYVLPWGLIDGPKCLFFMCIIPLKPKKSKPIFHHGPHNIDVISLLFGSLLGDSHGEKRGSSIRFSFKQSSRHVEYLMWFHAFLADRGYCNIDKPIMKTLIGKNGKKYFYYSINTYCSGSFNWFYEAFYLNGVKIIPHCIADYLTPFALAVWIMGDGGVYNKGLILSTYCFSHSDITFLCTVLTEKYKLKCTIHSKKAGFTIYVWPESMIELCAIVVPYMVSSMHYKVMRHSRQEL